MPTPDLQGFADAQARLRHEFGRDIRLYGPAAMLYDPALTPSEFDDEGIPLDPLAGASAVASAGVAIADLTLLGTTKGNVVFKPLQTSLLRRDQTQEQAIGIRSGLNKDLILDPSAYALASGATYFAVGTQGDNGWTAEDDELWKIVNVKFDSFGTVERLVVYGRGTR